MFEFKSATGLDVIGLSKHLIDSDEGRAQQKEIGRRRFVNQAKRPGAIDEAVRREQARYGTRLVFGFGLAVVGMMGVASFYAGRAVKGGDDSAMALGDIKGRGAEQSLLLTEAK